MASAELQIVIDMLRNSPPIPRDASIADQRAGMEQMVAAMAAPAEASIAPERGAARPAEWVRAAGARDDRTILYLHGGGYCIGSINTHRQLATDLSRAAAARVLVLDYRLAPEHPFPAAVDDAVAAYRFLLAGGARPDTIAIAGDSAGGGLTVATLLALRDQGVALPAAGVCLSPWLDLSLSGASMESRAAADPMVQRDPLQQMANHYLAGADPRTPLASPLFGELAGLPPLLVQVGDAETLLDDATRFVERARAAGVDARIEVWDDMIHVWQAFAFVLPEARQAIERIGGYLCERWA